MTTKTKILIGILVVVILAGGWWVWKGYFPEEYCNDLAKKISTKIEKLDKSCQSDGDCDTAELLRAIQANGAYPICVSKGEDINEIQSLQELQHKRCKIFLPHILITPAPFYGCECQNNVCTEIQE